MTEKTGMSIDIPLNKRGYYETTIQDSIYVIWIGIGWCTSKTVITG